MSDQQKEKNDSSGMGHDRRSTLKDGVTKLPREVRNVMAGGCAGMVAKSVVAPIERIKILYQVSAEKFVLRQVPVVALNIIRKEGYRALWRGNTATMLRVFPYSGIQFMVFDRCKTNFLKQHERQEPTTRRRNTDEAIQHFGLSPLESLISGMIAGAVSVMCTYPLDLTRAQLAIYKLHKHDSGSIGFIGVIRHNFDLGGIRGLFRGLTPTILGILPYSGIAFALNEQGKRKIQAMTKRDLTTIERMQCGAMSGLFAQTFSYPFEVTRRRMQTIGVVPGKENATMLLGLNSGQAGKAHKPMNMFGTMRILFHEQGIRGFFKGVTMNWMRGPIAFSISFTIFDLIQHLLETDEEREQRLPSKLRKKRQPEDKPQV